MLQGGHINTGTALLFGQAGLGAIGLTFARGVIARLALSHPTRDATNTPSLLVACQEAKARFGNLLAGSLLYSACIATGAVEVNAVLRDTDLDLRRSAATMALSRPRRSRFERWMPSCPIPPRCLPSMSCCLGTPPAPK